MSKYPGAPKGHVWTASENNVLRVWAENGYTIRQMAAMSADYFGEEFNDSSIRNHLNHLGIDYNHERKYTQTTQEMRYWMCSHYSMNIDDLTTLFNEVFHTDFTVRQVYKLAYRVGKAEHEKKASNDAFYEEWMKVRLRLNPSGQIYPKHWLWRYYPLDESRKTTGVTFRGKK